MTSTPELDKKREARETLMIQNKQMLEKKKSKQSVKKKLFPDIAAEKKNMKVPPELCKLSGYYFNLLTASYLYFIVYSAFQVVGVFLFSKFT